MNKNINEDISDFSNIPTTISNISNFAQNVSFGEQFLKEVVPFWVTMITGLLGGSAAAVFGPKIKTMVAGLVDKFIVANLKKDQKLLNIIDQLGQIQGSSQENNQTRQRLYKNAEFRIMNIFQNSYFLRKLGIRPEKQTQFLSSVRSNMNLEKLMNKPKNQNNSVDTPPQI